MSVPVAISCNNYKETKIKSIFQIYKGKRGKCVQGIPEMVRLYTEEKLSSAQIAERFPVVGTTICRYLKAAGVDRRPRYKGGRVTDKDGYIRILNRHHPRANTAGYVLEHILVWEAAHSRELPKDWVIHHINGVKGDNRAKNLFACSKKYHSPALNVKVVQQRLRELENELRMM